MTTPKPTFDLEVRTRIPAEHFKTLYTVAEESNTTVGALVAELVRRGLQPAPPETRQPWGRSTPEMLNTLVRLHEAGEPDTVIVTQTGMSPRTVRLHRARLGLPANKRKK